MELNENWSAQVVEEYKGYLHEKKMQDYVYHCEKMAPHVIHNTQVKKIGKQWRCELGDSAMGVVGYGKTPKEACAEFDRVWNEGV